MSHTVHRPIASARCSLIDHNDNRARERQECRTRLGRVLQRCLSRPVRHKWAPHGVLPTRVAGLKEAGRASSQTSEARLLLLTAAAGGCLVTIISWATYLGISSPPLPNKQGDPGLQSDGGGTPPMRMCRAAVMRVLVGAGNRGRGLGTADRP